MDFDDGAQTDGGTMADLPGAVEEIRAELLAAGLERPLVGAGIDLGRIDLGLDHHLVGVRLLSDDG